MNMQELIEKIKEIPRNEGFLVDTIEINRTWLLRELKQLEPQKPVIPKFVANYISYNKGWNQTLHSALINTSEEVLAWFCEDKLKRQDIFARAWLDGYTVEKEKRYLVKLKGIEGKNCYLKRVGNKWIISNFDEYKYMYIHTKHTRKELEQAGFGDVFNSPLFEIEEVEE